MNNKQVINELRNGYRMDIPEYAPRFIGEIMANCWKTDPKERPTFRQLEDSISGQIESSIRSYYCNLNVPYEKMNEEKESASSTDHFGLAKLLGDQEGLAENQLLSNELDGSEDQITVAIN